MHAMLRSLTVLLAWTIVLPAGLRGVGPKEQGQAGLVIAFGDSKADAAIDPSRQSPYGFHKALAEQCVRHAAPNWLIVRLGGAVGPGLKKNAIFDILQGGPLWLDPESRLQFLRTDDAARIVLDLVDRGLGCEVVNVCGKGTIALREAQQTWGREVQVQPGSPRVHYEVALTKLCRFIDVPRSRETVLDFVHESKLAFDRAA